MVSNRPRSFFKPQDSKEKQNGPFATAYTFLRKKPIPRDIFRVTYYTTRVLGPHIFPVRKQISNKPSIRRPITIDFQNNDFYRLVVR